MRRIYSPGIATEKFKDFLTGANWSLTRNAEPGVLKKHIYSGELLRNDLAQELEGDFKAGEGSEIKEDQLMLELTDLILNKLRAQLIGCEQPPATSAPVTSGLGAGIMMGEEYY